jgi:hypothetical protein
MYYKKSRKLRGKNVFSAEVNRIHERRLTDACAIILSRHGRASRARINAGTSVKEGSWETLGTLFLIDSGRHCKVRNPALCAFRTASYQKSTSETLVPKK